MFDYSQWKLSNSSSVTLKSRPRSPTFKLQLALLQMNNCCEFGECYSNSLWVSVHKNFLKIALWSWKVCQGHPSLNLIWPFIRWINAVSLVSVSQFRFKWEHSHIKIVLWLWKLGQGHPSSQITWSSMRWIKAVSLVTVSQFQFDWESSQDKS